MWLALDTFGQDVDAAKVVKFLTAKGMACSVYAAFAFVMGLYGLGRSSDTSSSVDGRRGCTGDHHGAGTDAGGRVLGTGRNSLGQCPERLQRSSRSDGVALCH